jgi:hypothetical protein
VNEALELELRQLPGVLFVSFSEADSTTYIELVATPVSEHGKVRDEAARAAVNHLEGPAEIRVMAPPQKQQVALENQTVQVPGDRVGLLVVPPGEGDAAIEVQLWRRGQSFASRAVAGDTQAVGRAVLEALRGLGAIASFDLMGFHALPSDWGAGLLAVLRDTRTGELRRGVANGLTPADAAARAVLHALNRSL